MNHTLAVSALLATAMASYAIADAGISIAPMFSAGAVIQRDVAAPVWGWAAPDSAVEVRLSRDGADKPIETVKATADASGRWQVSLPAQPAGGPYRLDVSDQSSSLCATNILFGDVWLCSGQSNMDMNYGWGLTRGKGDIETNSYPTMRLFDDANAISSKPLDALTRTAKWTASDFAHSRSFSACGWFFGQALVKAMPDIPIGLIEASWSGTPIRTWLSGEAYCAADPECKRQYDTTYSAIRNYEEEGGKEDYEKRFAFWTAESNARGDIQAEGIDYDDSEWKTVSVPVTFEKQFGQDFDGCVWYRRSFDLTAEQASATNATLHLGAIDDKDITYVNGVFVGSNTVWNAKREYKLPARVLREGRNVIAVRAIDFGGGGGFTDKADEILIAAPGWSVPLAGEWRSTGFAFDPRPVSGAISAWTPSACYNAMIHPLFPMALKGAIWYQGCSDVGNEFIYDKVFRAMATDWRSHFTHPDGMPIYLVQLAAFLQTHEKPIDSAWAKMRCTHMRLGETLPKSGTAVAIDIGHHTDIHPKDKKTVGERLARLAIVRTYGAKDIVEAGPIPLGAFFADGRVVVTFKNATGLKTSDGGPLKGFLLKTADADYEWCEATIEGETVAIAIPEGTTPESVRYAWDDYPDCNLVNGDDLPCGPFAVRLLDGDVQIRK